MLSKLHLVSESEIRTVPIVAWENARTHSVQDTGAVIRGGGVVSVAARPNAACFK